MKERPILFSSPMIRAILAGRKTQTRRIVKPDRAPIEVTPWDTPNVHMYRPNGELQREWYWMPTAARSRISCLYQHWNPTEARLRRERERLIRDGFNDRNWKPERGHPCSIDEVALLCPYGVPGDRLWVREAWQALHQSRDLETGVVDDVSWPAKIPTAPDDYWTLAYAATFGPMADETAEERGWPWRPGIHMPRWASRIALEITEIRVERLHDISERDCWAEGIEELDGTLDDAEIRAAAKRLGCSYEDARPTFALLWDAINGKPRPMLDDDGDPVLGDDERPIMVASASWDVNPWVWVVSFRRVEPQP